MDGPWSKVPFDPLNIATLRAPLNITPTNGDDTDENKVIHRIRGKTYKNATGTWTETTNKLGGIMHSAPAIIGAKSRVGNSRSEIAYVGDLYGMLHAIETASGTEKWAYIPKNLLGKLKNDRTDPNAVQDFAGVESLRQPPRTSTSTMTTTAPRNGAPSWPAPKASAANRSLRWT